MRKQVIAYLHTHWDREWYREFEIFRLRLLRVFDNVLDLLEKNKIPCFYFDGQVSALEDYLEMRPEKKDLIKSLIYSKKLFIGPFYCLVDEFLTDKSCFEKNLEIGMQTAINWGCTDFIGYLPDTFGHSANVVDIMQEFGIDKCMVWRGCGDFPADFKWNGMDTVNLVRGYFQNIFSLKISIEEKAKLIKKELDLISEKSGLYVLLPIGADHLGVEEDIQDQILSINEILKDEYNIKLGSPFDYFKYAKPNFEKYEFYGELRDNSKTFILDGVHSSRLDLKKYNTECSHQLNLASRFVRFKNAENRYGTVLEYAYKLLLQNQAHDSICGCSTDDVHRENIVRYKKILQITSTIIEELKFESNFNNDRILNLAEKDFSGIIELKSTKKLEGAQELCISKKGVESNLLIDTKKIPITEDFTQVKTFVTEVKNVHADEIDFIMTSVDESDLEITETSISNSKIKLAIKDNQIFINNIPFSLVDFADLGDSYNYGPKINDTGNTFKILRSKIIDNGHYRTSLKIDFEGLWDIISLTITLDKDSNFLKFNFDWNNTQKNHILKAKFELSDNIREVYSEDLNQLIKRNFDPDYNLRNNLPQERGHEAKTNFAPMQRGLLIDETQNNIGIVTKGLTQYEVEKNFIYIPILRATGIISNPQNPARTTPAGPPIDTVDSQMLGKNSAEFYVFFGNQKAFEDVINQVYNYIIV